jgi:hypothetical protein
LIADPIGVHIDPDELAIARDASASPDDIRRRLYVGELTPARPLDR